ncbi:hypothetical protein HY967_01605 [Candidatus Jorgensenbacteria bacterium]|nr:hypothetical protein [Candidatus Jorgensenbacteria bacterium]
MAYVVGKAAQNLQQTSAPTTSGGGYFVGKASQGAPTPPSNIGTAVPQGENFLTSLFKAPIKSLLVKPIQRTAEALVAAPTYAFGSEEQKKAMDIELAKAHEINLNIPGTNFGLGKYNIEAPTSGKQVAGEALEAGAYLVPGGKAAGLVKPTLKTLVKEGVKVGATSGGAFGAGTALQQGADVGETLKQAGTGAVVGGIAGGLIPPAVVGAGKVAGKVTGAGRAIFGRPKTEQVMQAVNELESKYKDIERGWVSTRKASLKAEQVTQLKNKAGTVGRTPERVLAESGIVPQHTGDTFTTKGQANKLREDVTPLYKANKTALKEAQLSTTPVAINDLENSTISRINSGSGTSLQKESMITKARSEFEALKREFGDTLNLDNLDTAKSMQWGATKFDMAVPQLERDVHYAVAKSMQEAIEESAARAGATDVAQLNREIGDILEASKFLENLDGKKVLYGRMGTHMLRLSGAIIGSRGGPLGSLAGAIGGDVVANILRNVSIASPVKRLILRDLQKTNPAAYIRTMNWLEKQGLARELRLALPAPSPLGSAKNPIITPPPTVFEKGVPQTVKPPAPSSSADVKRGVI